MSQKTVPVRFRLTEHEAARCDQAMERLGLTSRSTFFRWAIANSVAQVLGNDPPPNTQSRLLGSVVRQKLARAAAKAAPKPKVAPRPAQTSTEAPPSLKNIFGARYGTNTGHPLDPED